MCQNHIPPWRAFGKKTGFVFGMYNSNKLHLLLYVPDNWGSMGALVFNDRCVS